MKQKLLLVILVVILSVLSSIVIYTQNFGEYKLTKEEQQLLKEHEESL